MLAVHMQKESPQISRMLISTVSIYIKANVSKPLVSRIYKHLSSFFIYILSMYLHDWFCSDLVSFLVLKRSVWQKQWHTEQKKMWKGKNKHASDE